VFLSAQSDISRWSLTKPLIGDDDVAPFFRKAAVSLACYPGRAFTQCLSQRPM
jgi:hypothetical protein